MTVRVRYDEQLDSFYLPRTVYSRDEAVVVAHKILSQAEDARLKEVMERER